LVEIHSIHRLVRFVASFVVVCWLRWMESWSVIWDEEFDDFWLR